jgi:CrcB protein
MAEPPSVPLLDRGPPLEPPERAWDVVLVVSAGGVLGTVARYELGRALPHQTTQLPWVTLLVNASGCLAIGVLMVVLSHSRLGQHRRLVRPFIGVGILGGYTSYSTFATDVVRLVDAHRPGTAAAYVALTVLGCAVAVWLAVLGTNAVLTQMGRNRTGGNRTGGGQPS